MIKKYISLFFVLTGFSLITVSAMTSGGSECVVFKSSAIRYTSADSDTKGDVYVLQDFLRSSGYLKVESNGYFGPATLRAVKAFQMASGVSSTGYVGNLTKAKIQEATCNGQSTNDANTIKIKDSIKNGNQSTVASPVTKVGVCSTEVRICPDGTAMSRNLNNCEWLGWRCGVLVSEPKISTLTSPVAPVATSSRFFGTTKICSMEARLCSDGKMMGRNMDTCEWIVSSCVATTTSGNSIPLSKIIVPDIVKMVNPTVSCGTEVKMCPNGGPMYRDVTCGWHPEKCAIDTSLPSTQCTKNVSTGQIYCGTPSSPPVSY